MAGVCQERRQNRKLRQGPWKAPRTNRQVSTMLGWGQGRDQAALELPFLKHKAPE